MKKITRSEGRTRIPCSTGSTHWYGAVQGSGKVGTPDVQSTEMLFLFIDKRFQCCIFRSYTGHLSTDTQALGYSDFAIATGKRASARFSSAVRWTQTWIRVCESVPEVNKRPGSISS